MGISVTSTQAAPGGPTPTTDSIAEQYDALRRGCGLADRSRIGRLELAGADRLRFLHAYVTCEVKGLVVGQGAYGFFTNPQGRILADLVLMALADRLWLEVPPGQEEAITTHLRKYVIADRVDIHPLALQPIILAGPRAAAVLAERVPAAALPQTPWSHASLQVAGVEVTIQRHERLGVPAFTLWAAEADVAVLRRELLAGGVRSVGDEALEVVRVEAGVARFGQEFGPQSFPQETGAADAVSYTKG
jgi:glycine cleavage system aminomethyltransferase T